MPASESVKIKGLKELVKELKKLDGDGFVNELKDANYDVAKLVVDKATGNTSNAMESRAASTMKPSKQAAKAQIVAGGGIEFFMGAEFGAGKWKQFKPWRGAGSGAGYFLYPAIRSSADEVIEVYGDAIDKITKAAFPD